MRSDRPYSRFLLPAGIVLFSALACLALRGGRLSNPPTRASITPSTVAPAPAPPGFVCRSAHYTLTAEIHAGS